MPKNPVKTLYTAKFYETPSSSATTHPSSSKPQQSYMERLFQTHLALNQMEELPSSRPNSPDQAYRDRVESLRKQVVDAFNAANGNPANGKWGLLSNLLQTGTSKGKYRYVNTRTDAAPPRPTEGWLLADTEEEWIAWEKKRKAESHSMADAAEKKRKEDELLKEKVETWKRDIDIGLDDATLDVVPDSDDATPDVVPDSDDVREEVASSPTKHVASGGSKSASKSRARSIADIPEEPFLPPSFPADLNTSTPPILNRQKPSPIELVPSSSPLLSKSPPKKRAERPGPSFKTPQLPSKLSSAEEVPSSSPLSSPPRNSRVYGRPRPSESPFKRARSPSPTPLTTAKKSRPAGASGSGASTLPRKTPITPPRNPLPRLEDLIAASTQKKKAKGKEREKTQSKAPEQQSVRGGSKPQSKSSVKPISTSSDGQRPLDLEADIVAVEDAVINWNAHVDRIEENRRDDLSSPAKSLSSIHDSNSLESPEVENNMDLPDFSQGAPFDPQFGSTQPMGRLGAGESLSTTERGGRGFGQQVDFGLPMAYESQIDVESNMQGVEELLDADVGGYAGPWMGAGPDGDEDEQWGGRDGVLESSP
ncbi:hypothetical protein C8F04DRAFT_1137470 [Mycena alexandri]|uniref:Uncharacterized protein n=1 Tax=Mycena alexandri TaxID=1745969 RepID=A0AAD6SAB1_9AGAR|nr:hypothetical protein C8F04DRAFT_1137470 [Mycena alexandri]